MREIKIDFDNPGFPQRLDVVENDAQSRFFKAVLYKDGKAYVAPDGATYSIMYRGFGPQNEGWYDTINDGAGKRAACSASGNVVTCEIARQALRVPGHVSVVLCVTGSNGYMLHGWPIDCNCRNDSYTSGTSVESFFYITQVTNADWTSAIQTWEELKNMIDPTLSVSGKAADAAKVGEAINAESERAKGVESQLKEDLENHSLKVNEGFYNITETPFNGTKDFNNAIGARCLIIALSDDPEINKQNHTPPFTEQMLKIARMATLLNITPENTNDGMFQICFLRDPSAKNAPYLYYRSTVADKLTPVILWTPWVLISDPRTCFTSSNLQYNNAFPPAHNDLNEYLDNKAYEFDIGYTAEQIANAPFYPFKGTLLCFNPSVPILQENEVGYPDVGTVQIAFRSRDAYNYNPELHFRCLLGSTLEIQTWSPWAVLTPATEGNVISNFTPLECIEDFCVIGDSISAGTTTFGEQIHGTEAVARKANWPSYMALQLNRTVENLAQGGSTAQSWRAAISKFITKHECYILYLGGNDIALNLSIGSSSDIAADYSNNSDSYYGNYDYLVRYIHNYNPKAIIFCISNAWWDCQNEKYIQYNQAVKYVADLYDYSFYIDITAIAPKNNSLLSSNFNGHFSPVGYSIYGKYIQTAINSYIINHPEKFLTIPYSLTGQQASTLN
nr:MAG TPA: hydrolase [Caudoviricetes sp.]